MDTKGDMWKSQSTRSISESYDSFLDGLIFFIAIESPIEDYDFDYDASTRWHIWHKPVPPAYVWGVIESLQMLYSYTSSI